MRIIVEGNPVAKKRPRFARRGKFVATYSDQETEEGRFLLLAKGQIDRQRTGPLRVDCIFYMPRPKSHYGTGKKSGVLKQDAPLYHTKKPDIDNLQKMVYDCLNGFAWSDDSIVCISESRKVYSDRPRTEIKIMEVGNEWREKS